MDYAKIFPPLLLVFAFSLLPPVSATSHYSFEHAIELKPLIEWRDYGPDAFDEAIEQNKPIFLLLTAPSWCYWCQVYESEDYLFNSQVVDYLNENFIPVYVDADKRQDLTRQYLEGGWPSTTVLAPNGERLYGYSGPRPVSNMLANLKNAKDYVTTQGFSNQVAYQYEPVPSVLPTENQLNTLIDNYAGFLLQVYDPVHGGFGTGQKFPQGRALDFSLEMYELTGNNQFLELVQTTLQNQYTKEEELETNYNLFDPIEGGFHRYGTSRDWTPPHFEKMLYDNARLLRAYFHLLQLASDPLVREVVDKTLSYVETQWYDPKGGFYGNTDVAGELEYYGEELRPAEKPRVEKTKYSDWNAEAILTYLYLWKTSGNEKYKEMAEQSLDFFAEEMVTAEGAYHYRNPEGTKGVRGSLLDNSYLLLAFVEGYETLGKKNYRDTAQQLADYSLEKLYDWNSGGFFERNSPDTHLYAPGETIQLSKPLQENGIIAYALLKLYTQTGNPLYLNAGIKTIGANIDNAGGLDRGYYYVKAAQFITENNLLSDFSQIQAQVEEEEKEKQESFWLNALLNNEPIEGVETTGFVVSEEGLTFLGGPILLLLLIALVAGFISFASPCTLPILPAYLAYSFRSSQHNIKGMTLAFFLGLSIIFTLLGMTATLIGEVLKSQTTLFTQIAGIVIILFGLYILSGRGFAGVRIAQKKPTTYFSSFLFGGTMGLAWTPCVGPILVAVLLLASTTSSVLTGGLLLFIYAVGLAIPLILVSSYLGRINREGRLWKILQGKELRFRIATKEISIHTSSLISGVLFLILGILIFSGVLFAFNQYITTTPFQRALFGAEEGLLSFVQ